MKNEARLAQSATCRRDISYLHLCDLGPIWISVAHSNRAASNQTSRAATVTDHTILEDFTSKFDKSRKRFETKNH